MAESDWCRQAAEDIAAGRVSNRDFWAEVPCGKFKSMGARWMKECGDLSLRRYEQLKARGRDASNKRHQKSKARVDAILEAHRLSRMLPGQQVVDLVAIQDSSSKAWEAISRVCAMAVKTLDAAREVSTSNPHIQVWNGRLADTLHNFLKKADQWTEKGNKVVAVYNAFWTFGSIDTRLATTNPREYAPQMGSLTSALGTSLKTLPPPFNGYGEFLEKSGTFFVNMSDKLIPGQRSSARDYKPGGKFYDPYDRVYGG